MVGLHLAVLARKEIVSLVEGALMTVQLNHECHVELFLADVQIHHVPTGLSKVVGKIGNKGGIGIGFKFMNTSMLFVNSHLSGELYGENF